MKILGIDLSNFKHKEILSWQIQYKFHFYFDILSRRWVLCDVQRYGRLSML